jgi:hypothetical protein
MPQSIFNYLLYDAVFLASHQENTNADENNHVCCTMKSSCSPYHTNCLIVLVDDGISSLFSLDDEDNNTTLVGMVVLSETTLLLLSFAFF